MLTILAGTVPVLTRAIAISSDALVLIITWMKSARAWKTSLQMATHSRPKLLTLLVRDGEFLFVLSELKLTCLTRYSVFCVSMLSKVYHLRPADQRRKHSVCIEYRDLAVGCDH